LLSSEIGLVVLTGTIIIVLLILSIITFVIRYNNRILKLEIMKQKQLVEAEINSKETEQIRIARDIHDGVSSNLAVINLLLQGISSKLRKEENPETELQKMKIAIEETHRSIRSVSKNLLAHDIDVFGLSHAVIEMMEQTPLLRSSQSVNTTGNEDGLPVNKKVAIFRIIQEILSNAIKHSDCSMFQTDIIYKDENVIIEIEFDGQVFDFITEMKNSKGLGLRNIESRIQYLKGYITYHDLNSHSFFTVIIPKDAED